MNGEKVTRSSKNGRKRRRMKRPSNRRLMIRDLPPKMAKYLHPSLRNILASRQKRWNRGSPHFRLAVNLINRYRRPIKPRVLPFFCDVCHLASRRLDMILHHPCDEDEKKKNEKRDNYRKCAPYDFIKDIKIAQNAYKFLRKNGLAVMEKTPKPQHVKLPTFEKIQQEQLKQFQTIRRVPPLIDLCYQVLGIDDTLDCVPINEILIPMPSSSTEKKIIKKCRNHAASGTFCFRCRVLFNNFDEYSEHLNDEAEGNCKKALPEFQAIQTEERVGTMSSEFGYRRRRHRSVKRDVSHVRCTSCQAGNFESTDALYSHMIKCVR